VDDVIPTVLVVVKQRRPDKVHRRAARLELPDPAIVRDLDRRISELERHVQEVRVLGERMRMVEECLRVLTNQVAFLGRFSE